MKIEVKLYSYHDMDLVTLYKTGKVIFPETTKSVLNAYANQKVYRVKMKDIDKERLAKYPNNKYKKYYHYHVFLDSKEDAAAINLLKHITPGYRNNFIKSILRQYICGVFVSEYSINGNTEFFDIMSRSLQGNREECETYSRKKIKRVSSEHKKTSAEHEKKVEKRTKKTKEVQLFNNNNEVKQEPQETRSDIDDLLSAMTEQY